jgi:predicted dehydrogenase
MRRDYDELLITLKTWNKYYTDADELINDPAIDAIYIATPPDTHKYYGLKVALAGKMLYRKTVVTNLPHLRIF